MSNQEKLIEFYQQPPYIEDGHLVINEMFIDLKKKFKKLINKKLLNKSS